jgi:hypothetical protein
MATVDKLGGNWVIVRGGDINAPAAAADSLASQDTDASAIREFWTGGGWAGQYGLARLFATKEEAEAYLAEYRHDMA